MTNDQQQLGGAQAAAKKKATGSSPEREYVVLRPQQIADTDSEHALVIVGRFKGTTPKHARVEAAKSGKIKRADLEKGVQLRAVPASVFDVGEGTAKLEVREEFSA